MAKRGKADYEAISRFEEEVLKHNYLARPYIHDGQNRPCFCTPWSSEEAGWICWRLDR
jgi:hypothetical protein